MPLRSGQNWAKWALLGLVMLTVLQQLSWVEFSTAVETWDDDAGLFQLAVCVERGLRGDAQSCFAGAPYPPLIPSIAGLHFWLTGDASLTMALHSLWLWPALLCGAVFVGVRRECGVWAGLAAASMAPVIVWSLHIRGKFYTEVPLAALVVASVVCWVGTHGFRRRGDSLLLGFFLGLGLLAKWSFAFFLGPPMALAWALGFASCARLLRLRIVLASLFLLAIAGLVLGATGAWPPGLRVAPAVIGVGFGATMWFRHRYPGQFHKDTTRRWVNILLATGVLLAVAGPWYWANLPGLQAFLADNMAQKYHGDRIPTLTGLPFYPAVLLTRVLGTPLALLFSLGAGAALLRGRGRGRLAVWSLFALASGAFILGVLPYRAGRYLVAGLGLVAPIAVLSVSGFPRVGRLLWPALIVTGIAHQLSWIPLKYGWVQVPHHWSLFTLPERDLFGNSARGMADAAFDLRHPRWRFLPVSSPPVGGLPAPRFILGAVSEHAGETPALIVVVDPLNKVNPNSLQTERLAVGAPPNSDAVRGDLRATERSIDHWRNQAKHPPDTPESRQNTAGTRRLYIATVRGADTAPSELEVLLSRRSWTAVARENVGDAWSPVVVSVWSEDTAAESP